MELLNNYVIPKRTDLNPFCSIISNSTDYLFNSMSRYALRVVSLSTLQGLHSSSLVDTRLSITFIDISLGITISPLHKT